MVNFSADPYSRYTHWKQTVFYVDDFITVKKGEEVTGVFHLKPNKRNVVRCSSRIVPCDLLSAKFIFEYVLF
jgi:hypothetical protein